MVCDEGAIHAYFDGELEPARQAAVKAHLRICPACRQIHKEIGWLHGTLAEPRRPRLSWRPWMAAAALLALLFWSWQPRTPASPSVENSTYQVSLAGEAHQVKVEGAELVELSLGEEQPDHEVDLRKARIE